MTSSRRAMSIYHETLQWVHVMFIVSAALLAGGCTTVEPCALNTGQTIQDLWDYNDPAGSEQRFRDAIGELPASDRSLDYRLQLQTQIARTYSLRRQFDEAHALLDEVDLELPNAAPAVHVRYLLERGRTFNSSGKQDSARKVFVDAWETARANDLDGLAVDAAHMIAIVESGDAALQWNNTALQLAQSSDDPDAQRWRASLHNNLGWTNHERGEYETALSHFENALTAQQEKNDAELVRVAQWCIGRCYRSLGRIDEAFEIQRELEQSMPDDAPDGFVCEELAECLYALGRIEEARSYFHRAYDLLSQDAWLIESEPQRIERLRRLAQ